MELNDFDPLCLKLIHLMVCCSKSLYKNGGVGA